MALIPLGPWLPDRPPLREPHCRVARGVVATAEGYEPLASINEQGNALASRCQGVTAARDATGAVHLYAGTGTKLQELTAGTWSDVTRTSGGDYAVAVTGRWNFSQYKDLMLAVNGVDAAQSITMSSGGAKFANLAGSPPVARLVTSFSGFAMMAATATSRQQLVWSAIEDPTSWTAGTNQAGSVIFEDGGEITALAATDVLYVFQEYCIRRVTYVGPPQIFQIDVLERGRGPINQGAVAQLGGLIFYLARDGYYRFDGQSSQPIGAEMVDEFSRDEINLALQDRISSCVDPHHKLVVWSYVTESSPTSVPDRLMIYNWATGRWSYGDGAAVDILSTLLTAGFTLEELDALYGTMDSYPVPIDDPSLIGGVQRWGCVTQNNKVGYFTGTPQEALLETGDLQVNPRGRALTQFVAPIADTTTATVSVGAKERQGDAFAWSSANAQQASGRVSVRRGGRFHRVRVTIPAGATWTHINAIDIDAAALGVR